jgi:hypothetical protein
LSTLATNGDKENQGNDEDSGNNDNEYLGNDEVSGNDDHVAIFETRDEAVKKFDRKVGPRSLGYEVKLLVTSSINY